MTARHTADSTNIMAPRAAEVRRTLLRPSGNRLDGKALERKCLRALASLVWNTCDWDSGDYGERWKPGDFNFLVLESTYATDAILYAQIWSEPLEPVLFEVCSGEMNPGAKRHISEEARAKLVALGFSTPEGDQNFRKEIGVWSPGDAEMAAADMLRVLSDVFGYSGSTPLTTRLVRGERARRAVVHDALTPEDLRKILDHAGFKTTMATGTRLPMVRIELGGFAGGVMCDARKGESNLYTEFDCLSVIDRPLPEQVQKLTALMPNYRFIRCRQDDDGDVTFRASFVTHCGITTEAVVDFVTNFVALIQDLEQQVERLPEHPRRRKPKGAATNVVH